MTQINSYGTEFHCNKHAGCGLYRTRCEENNAAVLEAVLSFMKNYGIFGEFIVNR